MSTKSFTVTSDTAEYIQARGLVRQGRLVEVGRVPLPGGVIAATFEEPRGRRNPDDAPRRLRIKLDPREFVKVLRDYSHWQVKWWREAVQNAVDAGATKVYLSAKPTEDGLGVVVSCTDNGRGMSLDTFENKFLVLGGSGKEQSTSTIGGFGEAKKLLILPWLEWSVRSSNFKAHGSLAEGTSLEPIYEPASPIAGTELRVVMAANYGEYGAATSAECAMEFLQYCNLPHVQFVVNGEPFAERLVPTKRVSAEKYGEIWNDPSKDRNAIVVRANGLYMFSTEYVEDGLGTIVYELTARTVDILTSNRDGFRVRDAADPLYALTRKLAIEHKHALKEAEGFFMRAWKGIDTDNRARKYRVERHAEELSEAAGPTPALEEPAVLGPGAVKRLLDKLAEMFQRGEEQQAGYMAMASPEAAQFMFDAPVRGQEDVEATTKQLAWTPAFLVLNELAGFKPPDEFFPETMSPRAKALAQLWAELCRWVFIQKNSTAEWGTGYIFSDDAVAVYLHVPANGPEGQKDPATVGDWILLNPYMFKDGELTKELYAKTDRKHLQSLYASAIHEATHMADGVEYHDKAFASAVTRNFARCADGFQNVVKIAKSIKLERKPPKPYREKRIRDLGGVTLTMAMGGDSTEAHMRFTDDADQAVVEKHLVLRLQRSYAPEEIQTIRKKIDMKGELSASLYVAGDTLEALMMRLAGDDLDRYTAGRSVTLGLSVDEMADLHGVRMGIPPEIIAVRAIVTTNRRAQFGHEFLNIVPASRDYATLGTLALFRKLKDYYGFSELELAIQDDGVLYPGVLDYPFIKSILEGLGLDPGKSMIEQLGEGVLGDPFLVDAVGFLVCANASARTDIAKHGVETIMRPTTVI